MEPSPGKCLFVEKSELQFTHDISLATDKVFLEYYVWHPSFPGTPVLGSTITFDTLYSMFEYGNTHSHSPAIGTEIPHDFTTIHFNYVKKLVFHSAEIPMALAQLRVRTESGNPIGGTYCKATFVTEEKDSDDS